MGGAEGRGNRNDVNTRVMYCMKFSKTFFKTKKKKRKYDRNFHVKINLFWSSCYIFWRLQTETRNFWHILDSSNSHDCDHFGEKSVSKWLILLRVFWHWAQSLTFSKPQMCPANRNGFNRKKTKPGTTLQVVSHLQGLSLLGSTFPPGQRALPSSWSSQDLSLPVFIFRGEERNPQKGLDPFFLKVGEKHLLKLLVLSKLRSSFGKPGLAKVLNQSKMDLRL